jgi:hypothetical protein
VILGSGEVDLPNVLAALEERGYRGWIGLEPVDGFQAEAELADALKSTAGVVSPPARSPAIELRFLRRYREPEILYCSWIGAYI